MTNKWIPGANRKWVLTHFEPWTRCSQDVCELLLDDLKRCKESSRPFRLTVDRSVPTRSAVDCRDAVGYVYQRHLTYDIELLEERGAGFELEMEEATDVMDADDEADDVKSTRSQRLQSEKVPRQMC